MAREKLWIVYCHENKINKKKYIGITSQKLNRRWREGNGYKNTLFGKVIKKYGWDNFEHYIIEKDIPEYLIDEKEKFYITKFNTMIPNGYNSTSGGREFRVADKIKSELSNNRKGKIPGNLDVLHSKQTWNKISKSLTGKKNYSVAKEVECDGKIYLSVKDFCDFENLPYSKVYSWLEKKVIPKYYYDLQLKYVEDNFSDYTYQKGCQTGENHHHSKSVICLETKIVFNTIKEASTYYEIHPMTIINNCKNKRKSGGYFQGIKLHWMYYEEYLKGGENGCEKK